MKNTEIREHAIMLTQYAHTSTVSIDEFRDYIIDEIIPDPDVSLISEYLAANAYETYFDDIDDVLACYSPTEIMRMTYFGKVNWLDNWFTFDGNGNLESASDDEIISTYGADWKRWALDSYIWDDEIMAYQDEIIDECNRLIALGY